MPKRNPFNRISEKEARQIYEEIGLCYVCGTPKVSCIHGQIETLQAERDAMPYEEVGTDRWCNLNDQIADLRLELDKSKPKRDFDPDMVIHAQMGRKEALTHLQDDRPM